MVICRDPTQSWLNLLISEQLPLQHTFYKTDYQYFTYQYFCCLLTCYNHVYLVHYVIVHVSSLISVITIFCIHSIKPGISSNVHN